MCKYENKREKRKRNLSITFIIYLTLSTIGAVLDNPFMEEAIHVRLLHRLFISPIVNVVNFPRMISWTFEFFGDPSLRAYTPFLFVGWFQWILDVVLVTGYVWLIILAIKGVKGLIGRGKVDDVHISDQKEGSKLKKLIEKNSNENRGDE